MASEPPSHADAARLLREKVLEILAANGAAAGTAKPAGGGEASGSGIPEPATDPQRAKEDRPKRKLRKTVNVDGVRTVNYYRFTEHELDFVAEPLADASRAKAIAAFALGLFINAAISLSFGTPSSDTVKGVWMTIGLSALAAALYYFFAEYRPLRNKGKTRLQRIKEEHHFE
jgi:hypothetical protein